MQIDKSYLFIGIDPGLKGAIASLDESGHIILKCEMPVIGNITDLSKVASILQQERDKDLDIFVCLEENHARTNRTLKSITTFLRGNYGLEGLLAGLAIPYIMAKPQIWQKPFHAGMSCPLNANRFSDEKISKQKSLIAAQRLFPGETFQSDSRSGIFHDQNVKPHDGIVDALLMAEFARQRHWGIKGDSSYGISY